MMDYHHTTSLAFNAGICAGESLKVGSPGGVYFAWEAFREANPALFTDTDYHALQASFWRGIVRAFPEAVLFIDSDSDSFTIEQE